MRTKQCSLFHFAAHAQFIRRIERHRHFDRLGGLIGDAAVQRELSEGAAAVRAGRAVRRQAATAQPFVETGEPAKAAAVGKLDVLRMNRAGNGRTPTERQAVVIARHSPMPRVGSTVNERRRCGPQPRPRRRAGRRAGFACGSTSRAPSAGAAFRCQRKNRRAKRRRERRSASRI